MSDDIISQRRINNANTPCETWWLWFQNELRFRKFEVHLMSFSMSHSCRTVWNVFQTTRSIYMLAENYVQRESLFDAWERFSRSIISIENFCKKKTIQSSLVVIDCRTKSSWTFNNPKFKNIWTCPFEGYDFCVRWSFALSSSLFGQFLINSTPSKNVRFMECSN